MRVLTVRQPWAWAIIHGQKNVENRSRNIAGYYRGPVAIHAGLREDTSARAHPEISRLARHGGTTPGDLLTGRLDQFGRIIGVVDLVDVHQPFWDGSCDTLGDGPCSPWAETTNWPHHLVLANPRPLTEPIPFKGSLGLRTLSPEVEAAIAEQMP